MYYTSKDLATWEGPRIAFVVPESSWADPKVGAWAPEAHEYQGKYWLFTTLHNPKERLTTTDTTRPNLWRATVIAVSDSPAGPFTLTKTDAPVTPREFMTLDGTLYVDRLDERQSKKARKAVKRNGWGKPGQSWHPGVDRDPFGHDDEQSDEHADELIG